MSDDREYQKFLEQCQREWEARCSRCGACCGVVEGDPCEHLRRFKKGGYYCSIYTERFGLHKTVGGRPFRCVPIRDILHKSWPGDQDCAYKKDLSK